MFGLRVSQSEVAAYPEEPGGGAPSVVELPERDAAFETRLRTAVDQDPVVEEAAQRLRDSLSHLDARDEWGRPVAWHLVARIALGAVLPEVSRLLGRLPGGGGESDLLAAARAEVEWERSAVAESDLTDDTPFYDLVTEEIRADDASTGLGWPS